MATRIGGGTGVIVALVVFVLSTVFLLVLTIVFYAGQTKEREARANDKKLLAEVVSNEERNRPEYTAWLEQSKGDGSTVFGALSREFEQAMGFVGGDPKASLDQVQIEFGRMGVDENSSVRNVLSDIRRERNNLQSELQSANERITSQEGDIQDMRAQAEQARRNHDNELQAVRDQLATYEESVTTYLDELVKAKRLYETAVTDLEGDYRQREQELEIQIDDISAANSRLQARVDDLKKVVDQYRIKPASPAELVDGRVIDVVGNDQVFINIGRDKRVVRGMTFEIYGNTGAIRPDDFSGEYPRGKASIEVIRVGDVTSTCKVTRSIPGRPVVRDDVLANAIFDPDYEFKFLVHGVFDIDGDGRATDAEAQFLRDLIVNWGGAVVTGDELTGDLDFLVLGEQPPHPGLPPTNMSSDDLRVFTQRRAVHEKYNALWGQALKAQIPVLNWNRLSILIGHTDR